jgi:hypothetical protein
MTCNVRELGAVCDIGTVWRTADTGSTDLSGDYTGIRQRCVRTVLWVKMYLASACERNLLMAEEF